MAEETNMAELKTEIAAMVAEALKEAGVSPEQSPVSPNERAERRAEHELKMFARKMDDPSRSSSRPTNPKRHEDLQARFTESRAPVDQPIQKKNQTVEGGGDTIEVVVVDNGVFKTGNFLIKGALTAVV